MALEKIHFETCEGETLDVPRAVDGIRRKQMLAINKKLAKGEIEKDEFDDELFKASKFTKAQMDIIDNMTLADYDRFTSEWTEGFSELGK